MSGGMAGIEPGSAFEADPLGWLDSAAREGAAKRWITPRQLCILDAEAARALLRNEDGLLVAHSDFFGPQEEALGPRAAQIALARACHALIQAHVRSLDFEAEAESLGARSLWPAAGNRLLFRMIRPVLASADRPPAIHAALDHVLEDRIANRSGRRKGPLARLLRRVWLARAILRESSRSRPGPARDVLDIIADAKAGMKDGGIVHLYLALVFAAAGSVAFALGWSLLLALRNGRADSPPQDLVREALRLYPVAWLLERSPAGAAEIAGEALTPDHVIVISPYAVHRSAAHWPEAEAFLPERWQSGADRRAWLPFGAGPQSCVAASLSVDIAAQLLGAILAKGARIEGGDGPPSVKAALAPPEFILHRKA